MRASADPAAMGAVATALDEQAGLIGHEATASATILASQGHWSAAGSIGASLGTSSAWANRWAASIRHRVAVLEAGETIAISGPSRVALYADQRTLDAFARLATLTGSALLAPFLPPTAPPTGPDTADTGAVGLALADELTKALGKGDAGAVLAVMNILDAVADDPAVVDAFLVEFDLDMIRNFPLEVHWRLGVLPDELHLYFGPMGRALGTATRSKRHPIPFTGVDLMRDLYAALTPAVYFDFGEFDPEFVLDALVAFLPIYNDPGHRLNVPGYFVDGGRASPDPRLPLIRALSATQAGLVDELVRRLARDSTLGSLLAPGTPWNYEGAAVVGDLLAALDAAGAPGHVEAAKLVIEGSPAWPISPEVAVGIAGMIAPHLGKLDELAGERGDAVYSLILQLVAVPEARQILAVGAADLMATTIEERFDPNDSSRLRTAAGDLGAALSMVFSPALDHDLAVARSADATIERVGFVVSFAASVLTAPLRAGWVVEAGVGRAADALIGTPDNVERVLLETLDQSLMVRDQATLIIARLAHEHGLIEVPECLLDGPASLVPRHHSYWDALEATLGELEAFEDWGIVADGIAGRAIPIPRSRD